MSKCFAVLFLFATWAFAQSNVSSAPIIQLQNAGSTSGTVTSGVIRFNAGAGIVGTWNNTTKTFTFVTPTYCGTNTGTPNALACSPAAFPAACTAGLWVDVGIVANNTGAVTLNVADICTGNVIDSSGNALVADALEADSTYRFVRDQTNTKWQLSGGTGGASGAITDVLAGLGLICIEAGSAVTCSFDPDVAVWKAVVSGLTLPLADFRRGGVIIDTATTPPTLSICTTDDGTDCTAARPITQNHSIGAVFSGASLTAGTTVGDSLVYLPPLDFACTTTNWTVTVAPSGTAGVRFWKIAAGTAIPTVANTLNDADMAVSSGTSVSSTSMTPFLSDTAPTFAIGDLVAVQLNAVSTATYVAATIQCR